MSIYTVRPGTKSYRFCMPKLFIAEFLKTWLESEVSATGTSFEVQNSLHDDQLRAGMWIVILTVNIGSLSEHVLSRSLNDEGMFAYYKGMLEYIEASPSIN
jgi:hypothetical protein